MPKPRKEVDLVQLQKDINAQTWRKTNVRGGPHEYFIRCQNPSLWDRLAQLVKEKGVRQLYPQTGRKYRYYYHTDGYRYWHFKIIMNRSKVTNDGRILVNAAVTIPDPTGVTADIENIEFVTFAIKKKSDTQRSKQK